MRWRCRCCRVLLFLLPVLALAAWYPPGSAAARWSAETPKHIGVIVFGAPFMAAARGFEDGLAEFGLDAAAGTVVLDVHDVGGQTARIVPLVDALTTRRYDLLLTVTTPVALAVRRRLAGSGPPMIFTAVSDPVDSGIVGSLRHPGGRVTGISHLSFALLPKRLELFAAAFPARKRVAVIYNPDEPFLENHVQRFLLEAAFAFGIRLVELHARSVADMTAVCGKLRRERVDGIFMVPDPLPVACFDDLLSASRRERLPLMVIDNMLLDRGGVLGYSPDFYHVGRQAAAVAADILNGAAAGDIPVQNPRVVKLVFSQREADALGLEVDPAFYLRIDEIRR